MGPMDFFTPNIYPDSTPEAQALWAQPSTLPTNPQNGLYGVPRPFSDGKTEVPRVRAWVRIFKVFKIGLKPHTCKGATIGD